MAFSLEALGMELTTVFGFCLAAIHGLFYQNIPSHRLQTGPTSDLLGSLSLLPHFLLLL